MAEEDDVRTLKRDEQKALKDLKIITAISIGKDRNKEIASVLDTDKSFAAKKVKDLEERGLVYKEGAGKETRYKLNPLRVLEFLQRKVVIKWRERVPAEPSKILERPSETELASSLQDESLSGEQLLSQNEKEVLEWLRKKKGLEK